MPDRVESLRENRRGATVIFTAFTRMKEKYDNNIFCCFEGDDSKYYFARIENWTKYSAENIEVLNCQGKSEVLKFHKMINQREEYSNVKLLYFVDKDFDPINLNEFNNVYQTPVYSIENFYTTKEAFIRILKCEFNYTNDDEDFSFLIKIFDERQNEFHSKMALFNAWLSCQRDKSSSGLTHRLDLSSFSLNKIVTKITIDEIESNYDKTVLEILFPQAILLTDEEIQNKLDFLSKCEPQETFRGKFEIDFLFLFLESVKIEFKSKNPRVSKKNGFQLNQSKKNMISEFSQYASTKECLIKYLDTNKIQ